MRNRIAIVYQYGMSGQNMSLHEQQRRSLLQVISEPSQYLFRKPLSSDLHRTQPTLLFTTLDVGNPHGSPPNGSNLSSPVGAGTCRAVVVSETVEELGVFEDDGA